MRGAQEKKIPTHDSFINISCVKYQAKMVQRLSLIGLFLFASAEGIRNSDIFPYGPPAGDNQLDSNAEDSSSREIELGVEAKFFNRRYRTVFVSN